MFILGWKAASPQQAETELFHSSSYEYIQPNLTSDIPLVCFHKQDEFLLTPARSVWAAYGSVPQMLGISDTDFLFLRLLSRNFDLGIEMGH